MSIMSFPRGVLVGAAVMYFMDPVRGRARRARVRDAGTHIGRELTQLLEAAVADAQHRVHGIRSELEGHARGHGDERVIRERVRSQLGHVVSYPSAIEVIVEAERVILRGPILADEADLAVLRARTAAGVPHIIDELERHVDRDIPELQGNVHEPNPDRWRASSRGLAVIGGAGLALVGFVRGGVTGTLQLLAGLALAGRGGFDLPLTQLPRKAIQEIGAVVRETPGGMFPGHARKDENVTEASVVG